MSASALNPARIPAGVGLYIHWPYCEAKCPYCDFNSHVAPGIDEEEWCRALVSELEHFASIVERGTVTTVFFGGGTPSLMSPKTVSRVLDAAARNWSFSEDCEVTLEANPSSSEAGKFRAFREAGVNRLSVGVQSLDDSALRFLGRLHDSKQARNAVRAAARVFQRYSLDLIYALPGQVPEAWKRELRDALAMAGNHLSLYQLTIERGTAFYPAHRRGEFRIPDDDEAVALMEITAAETSRAGFPAYEISNHARPGGECQHNLNCWRGGYYIGAGPGAHGRVAVGDAHLATEQIPGPAAWLQAVQRHGHGTRRSEQLDRISRIEELLLNGLRLVTGIERSVFHRISGQEIEEYLDIVRLRAYMDQGLLELDDTGLRATPFGLRRLDALIAALAPNRS